MPSLTPANIPAELKARPQWVLWRYETRDGKPTKVPYAARTRRRASVDDPATWATFGEALAVYEQGQHSGVGYVLTQDDPFTGVDLDDCLDDAGRVLDWAAYHVEGLHSYTETTPSGKGLRIFIRAKLPPGRRRLGDIEVYDAGRFLTLTGQHLPGTPTAIYDRADVVDFWHQDTFGQPAPSEPRPPLVTQPIDLDDARLIEKAHAARSGSDFAALWRGDTSLYQGDDSRADYHLCRHLLFWTGGDSARADWLFRQSGLMRDKWNERRGDSSYGERTMAAALQTLRAIYTPQPPYANRNSNGHSPDTPNSQPVADGTPTGPAPAASFNMTDLGNGERLVARYGQDLRYCHVWGKWLIWDGRRWAIDTTREVERRAKATIRAIYSEAAAVVGDDDDSKAKRRALASWATKSESRAKLLAMIDQAASEPCVAVEPDDLDRDPWLLSVLNGTLDLRTGQLRTHNRADLITRLAPVEYDPDATAPLWGAFLARIMDNRASVIEFLQRAVGYSLTGDTSERCLFIAHGTGANGKSTFVETLAAALGDYSLTTPAETLMIRRDAGIPNDVARLRGARFVSASETEEGRRLAESLVKRLTGGTDQVSARFLHGEFFDFRPIGKFWLSTNHRPTIRGTDNAIWSRIRLIPFDVTIPSSEQDKRLPAKLKTELPGILAWAVRGCLEWQRDGLDAPAEVTQATASYRADSDDLAAWLAECCVMGADKVTTAAAAFASYVDHTGDKRITKREFGARLKERGFQQGRTKKARGWSGFELLDSLPLLKGDTGDAGDAKNSIFEDIPPRVEKKAIPASPCVITSPTTNGTAPPCAECDRPALRHTARGWLCAECIEFHAGLGVEL